MQTLLTAMTAIPLPATTLTHLQQEALHDTHQRLHLATTNHDHRLTIGTAKELVEATARCVLATRGTIANDNTSYAETLSEAHKALQPPTTDTTPANDQTRSIPAQARKMATELGHIRNNHGTGHGRATLHPLTEHTVEMAIHAALIWTRWALTRLADLHHGVVLPLIDDLDNGTPFHQGHLASRLQAINLHTLPEPDQRALGLAIGRRATQQTLAVQTEGVDPATTKATADNLPPAYREGILQGLFLDIDGQIHPHPRASPRWAAGIIEAHPDPDGALQRLQAITATAPLSPDYLHNTHGANTPYRDFPALSEARNSMAKTRHTLSPQRHHHWDLLTKDITSDN